MSKSNENDAIVIKESDVLDSNNPNDENSIIYAGILNNNVSGNNQKNNSKKTKIGIPCTIFEDGNEIKVLPKLIYDLFAKEYGLEVDYNVEEKLIFFVKEIESTLKISNIAKKLMKSELLAKNNKNKLVVGTEIQLPAEFNNTILNVPAVTSPNSNTSFFDLSFYDESLDFIKFVEYIGFKNDTSKRTTNFAKVFEHDFLGHNVKKIYNNSEENPLFGKGQYKPGKVELFLNKIRTEIDLSEYLALNYQLIENGKSVRYFGNTTQLNNISSKEDLSSNSNAKIMMG